MWASAIISASFFIWDFTATTSNWLSSCHTQINVSKLFQWSKIMLWIWTKRFNELTNLTNPLELTINLGYTLFHYKNQYFSAQENLDILSSQPTNNLSLFLTIPKNRDYKIWIAFYHALTRSEPGIILILFIFSSRFDPGDSCKKFL